MSVVFGLVAATATAEDPKWVNPTITNYGAVVSLPQPRMQPSKDIDYKVVFNEDAPLRSTDCNPLASVWLKSPSSDPVVVQMHHASRSASSARSDAS